MPGYAWRLYKQNHFKPNSNRMQRYAGATLESWHAVATLSSNLSGSASLKNSQRRGGFLLSRAFAFGKAPTETSTKGLKVHACSWNARKREMDGNGRSSPKMRIAIGASLLGANPVADLTLTLRDACRTKMRSFRSLWHLQIVSQLSGNMWPGLARDIYGYFM